MWITEWPSPNLIPYDPEQPVAASTPLAHQARLVAVPVAHFLALTLVVQLLAAPKRNRDLGSALGVKVDSQRHDRHALALDAFGQLGNFLSMQKEFSRSLRLMVEAVGLQVFGNVGVVED